MLDFFKKREKDLYAIASGDAVPIKELRDGMFSKGTIGDGIVIKMNENQVCSPCSGILSMVFPTLHAFGVRSDDGMEILVHIGIDTVNLKGKGFTLLADKESRVKRGQPIINVDRSILQSNGYDCDAILVITNANNLDYEFKYMNGVIAGKSIIVELEANS